MNYYLLAAWVAFFLPFVLAGAFLRDWTPIVVIGLFHIGLAWVGLIVWLIIMATHGLPI